MFLLSIVLALPQHIDLPVPQLIDLSWSLDSVTFIFWNWARTHQDRWCWWGGGKGRCGCRSIISASSCSSIAPMRQRSQVPQPIDLSWSLDSVTLNFLKIRQELNEIGDVGDWWERRNGGGFLGKTTTTYGRWCTSLFLVPYKWTKG